MWKKISLNILLAVAIGLVGGILPGCAQVQETAPIRIKLPKAKVQHFEGYVLNVTRIAITVRDKHNANLVRTFSIADKLRPHWERRYDSKPYQYGDHVKIDYLAGSDTAVKVKGTASGPIGGTGIPLSR